MTGGPAVARAATPLALTSFTATSCLGRGAGATLEALRAQRTGLLPCRFETVSLPCFIGEVAGERGLQVAQVSRNFVAPWAGKFSVDNFHPSQDGYRDWSRALLQALPAAGAAAAA